MKIRNSTLIIFRDKAPDKVAYTCRYQVLSIWYPVRKSDRKSCFGPDMPGYFNPILPGDVRDYLLAPASRRSEVSLGQLF